jgi:hypothetical protein
MKACSQAVEDSATGKASCGRVLRVSKKENSRLGESQMRQQSMGTGRYSSFADSGHGVWFFKMLSVLLGIETVY